MKVETAATEASGRSKPPLEKLLFDAASALGSAAERERFLDFCSRGDPERVATVRDLLGVASEADDFFEFEPQVDGLLVQESDQEGLGVGIGRYRLVERLGAGGCGVVYLAEQQKPVRRKVALKIIRLGLEAPEVLARFEAESQALASMTHPNIARVLDAGRTPNGRPYFAMELVDGERITDYCDGRGMGIQQRLELFASVCGAIQHAHQRGVVHRDIKPANILVETHGAVPVPKVIDFGLAAETGKPEAGEKAGVMGTPAYMSPEQILGEAPVDTRSDIYSLGILLAELLAGPPRHVPEGIFERGRDAARRKLAEIRPVLPSATLQTLPAAEREAVLAARGVSFERLLKWCAGELDWIVRKAIAPDPADRYASVHGIAADVSRWLGGEPVAARPQTRRYRFAKLVSRNRLVFGAVTLAVLGLLGGTGIATVLFLREKAARAQAELARAAEAELRERSENRVRLSEAAVRIRYGDFEGADALVSGIPVEHTPPSLEAVDVFSKLAEWHLFAGRREQVDSRFLAMTHALASVDKTDNDSVSNQLLPAATGVCLSGDADRYRWFQRTVTERFAGTRNPLVAEQILKASLLKPAGDGILERLRPLAARVEAGLEDAGSRTARDADLRAWSCFSIALMNYRDGRNDEAVAWAMRSLSHRGLNPTCGISAKILLGLVEMRKGRRDVAAGFLRSAVTDAGDRLVAELSDKGWTETGFWFDWVNVRLLLEEAGWPVEPG